ncbi:VOC family protein [Bradyrhizobium sp. SSUT18]|uniref:VOC family protein n=1 Tax=Bradyrhizobium sp. SSUT18 TaxID=3040602 RepID=UPI00244D374F|nr:VOC family protein [Bradyrhizobium sp. SSUT18]MDH2401828.1 VOC family protein [Bradyrhizobium sp. SSUT18]
MLTEVLDAPGSLFRRAVRVSARKSKREAILLSVRRLSHVVLETPDVQREVEHYERVIGLIELGRDGSTVHLGMPLGALAITIQKGPHARPRRVVCKIDSDTDLSSAARTLRDHGVSSEVKNSPYPGIASTLSFQGPDDLVVDLFSSAESQQRRSGSENPIKLGHAAFCTQSLNATVSFYKKVLGFRFSDSIEDLFVWLRCNSDHHTLNFLSGKRAGLHHLAFEFLDRTRLLDACEVLGSHDIDIAYGPARAGPGHNLHVYHRAPDGYLIEFFAELDQMSDEESGCFDPRPWHRDKPQRPKVWKREGDRLAIWGAPPPADFLE